ncbi:MAG: 4Fe-4S binding protein [Spirochaetes bacterium]|nr:4Fe-4S binding protein [Spirochaetota bacterium]
MGDDIYRDLQARIDSYSIGFPATKTGVEMRILEHIFSPDEAAFYLHLSRTLEPAEAIAERAGMTTGEAEARLVTMTGKGLTFPKRVGDLTLYAAAPFMHGFYEHNAVMREDRTLMGLFEEYFTGGFIPRGRALRTVPVHAGIEGGKSVQPFDDVLKILQGKDRIGVMPCACAKKMQTLERGCRKPLEVCIAFDFYAEYAIEGLGVGRWIDRDEARAVLELADREGLVHQTGGDARNVECICNCCVDCCSSLRLLKFFPVPSKIAGANYRAQQVPDACTSCGTCVARCPMGALTMEGDALRLNIDRCIGCGLCASACTAGAIVLVQKDQAELRRPPSPERYTFMKSSLDYEADVKRWGG